MAYGREGHRLVVQRCVRLAQHLAARLNQDPRFEVCAPVRLNVVCFRPHGVHGEALGTAEIKAYVDRVLRDGRMRVTFSMLDGQPIIRAALVNWRTCSSDINTAVEALTASLA